MWEDYRDLATILNPFQTMFTDLVILGHPPYLRLKPWHSTSAIKTFFNIGIQGWLLTLAFYIVIRHLHWTRRDLEQP